MGAPNRPLAQDDAPAPSVGAVVPALFNRLAILVAHSRRSDCAHVGLAAASVPSGSP